MSEAAVEAGPAFVLGQQAYDWKVLHEEAREIERGGEAVRQVSRVRLYMRPADALDYEMAEHAAKQAVAGFNENADMLEEYGLGGADRSEVFGDSETLLGTSGFLMAVELAVLTVKGVDGVQDAEGKPVEATRKGFASLLRHSYAPGAGATYANKFLIMACAPLWRALEEGNALAAEPNGNGSAAGKASAITAE